MISLVIISNLGAGLEWDGFICGPLSVADLVWWMPLHDLDKKWMNLFNLSCSDSEQTLNVIVTALSEARGTLSI